MRLLGYTLISYYLACLRIHDKEMKNKTKQTLQGVLKVPSD